MDATRRRRPGEAEKYVTWLTLTVVLLGTYLVLRPFLLSAVLAGVLTFLLWHMTGKLSDWLGGHRTIAALVTTSLAAILLFVPFLVFGLDLASEIRSIGAAIQKWGQDGGPTPPAWLEKVPLVGPSARKYVQDLITETAQAGNGASHHTPGAPSSEPAATSRLATTIMGLLAQVRSFLLTILVTTTQGVLLVVLGLIITCYLLSDEKLGDHVVRVAIRIAGKRGIRMLRIIKSTIRGVLYAIVGNGIAQGLAAGLGFFIAGVPAPLFLGLVTAFLSLLPIGPPLLWVPASIWFFAKGENGWAIFIFLWGLLVISTIDNVIRPWLMSKGSQMPFAPMFFGVIGGALAFGFVGIFLGPLLLAITSNVMTEWLSGPQKVNSAGRRRRHPNHRQPEAQ
jgi:predicted PurR-regulated permease PerM